MATGLWHFGCVYLSITITTTIYRNSHNNQTKAFPVSLRRENEQTTYNVQLLMPCQTQQKILKQILQRICTEYSTTYVQSTM